MRFHESHFWYNKSQRNGILFLAGVITCLQVVIYFTDEIFAVKERVHNPKRLEEIREQLDSMQRHKKITNRFETYPFNPNFISDYKGFILGMSTHEIDRLMAFRNEGKFVNSSSEFQQVTGISDSLLAEISPYFKFPEFANKNRKRENEQTSRLSPTVTRDTKGLKKDLNSATVKELQKVKGIGPVLAKRIISYRTRLRGYSFEDQLREVYNLPAETVDELLTQFEIKNPPVIHKLNINTASFKEILRIPYINYELTRKIIAFRTQEKLITDLADLKKIDSFPLDKYDRIAVYLFAE